MNGTGQVLLNSFLNAAALCNADVSCESALSVVVSCPSTSLMFCTWEFSVLT